MKEQLIELETAILAKEKGFDLDANYAYNPISGKLLDENTVYSHTIGDGKEPIEAPTQSLLQKWLREEFGIYVQVTIIDEQHFEVSVWVRCDDVCHELASFVLKSCFEQALEKGLQRALKEI